MIVGVLVQGLVGVEAVDPPPEVHTGGLVGGRGGWGGSSSGG